jgi:hypothetical protein
MLDNLNEAYNAYQTALYHLQNLRVSSPLLFTRLAIRRQLSENPNVTSGTKAMVWHWHSLRQIWLA